MSAKGWYVKTEKFTTQRYSVFYDSIIVVAHEIVSWSSGISISIFASLAGSESARRRIMTIRLTLTTSTSRVYALPVFAENPEKPERPKD